MSQRNTLLILIAAAGALSGGCRKAPTPSATQVNAQATPVVTQSSDKAIETQIVSAAPIAGVISATGKISVPEDRTAIIGPVNEGRIVKLYAGQGSVVRKGQKLADLESADIDQAEADYLKALADLENANRMSAAEIKFTQATYDRTKLLVEKEITPAKNLQQAEHDLDVAKANQTSSIESAKVAASNARRHLQILGMNDSAIDALSRSTNVGRSTFPMNSPISGTVVERNGTIGATVGSDANVFKIIDLSRVWVDANIFEKDLERVRVGQLVNVKVPAFPDLTFAVHVILIISFVDPDTISYQVRTEVDNPEGRLKPAMLPIVEIASA